MKAHACQYASSGRVRPVEVPASSLVASIVSSVYQLAKLKMRPEFVSMSAIWKLLEEGERLIYTMCTTYDGPILWRFINTTRLPWSSKGHLFDIQHFLYSMNHVEQQIVVHGMNSPNCCGKNVIIWLSPAIHCSVPNSISFVLTHVCSNWWWSSDYDTL